MCLKRLTVAEGEEVNIMNTINIVSISAAIVMTVAAPRSGAGQESTPVREGPVSVSVLGGVSVGSGRVGAAAGLTLSVDVSDRVSLEGRSVYFDRGPSQSAMDVNLSLLVDLMTGRRAVPYLSVGGGLYRAMFDGDDQRFSEMMGGFASGDEAAGQMPMFYARRYARMTAPTGGRGHMRGFTDPAVSVGGGVRLDLTSRLYVRPDLRAVTIFGGGDTYTVGSATISVGYRF